MSEHPESERFWETTPLSELSPSQWEALCDHCAKCCLTKYEDADSGIMHYTDVACFLLDRQTCLCRDYSNRLKRVSNCLPIDLRTLAKSAWLPQTCAYRLLAEGKPLPAWHPLRSGDPESVVRSGNSVRGRVRCETTVKNPLHHLIDWVC